MDILNIIEVTLAIVIGHSIIKILWKWGLYMSETKEIKDYIDIPVEQREFTFTFVSTDNLQTEEKDKE